MSDNHDLAAAYVLNAIEGRELRRYQSHLAKCGSCQADVARLSEAAGAMAVATEVTPPERLRGVILSRIGDTSQEERRDPVVSMTQRRWSWVAIAAVAVVALGIGSLIGIQVADSRGSASRILAQPDARVVALNGEGQANFVYSASIGEGVLIASGLDDLGTDMTYQLWLIGDSGAVPSGLFQPAEGAATVEVRGDIANAAQLGITREPARGSPAPTGDIELLADLG